MTGDAIVELMGKYFEGVCSSGERDALVSLLSENPAHRRHFLREAYLRTTMRQWARLELARPVGVPVEAQPAVVRGARPARRIHVRGAGIGPFMAPTYVRPRVGSGTWLLRAAACLAVLAGGYALYRQAAPPLAPEFAIVRRAADGVLEQGELRTAAQPGSRVRVGDRISVSDRGHVQMDVLGEPSTVSARSGAMLGVTSVAQGKHFRLDAGTLDADIAPQPAGRPLVVETPQARAMVVGTRFTLDVQPRRTRLEVREGHVRLTRLTDQAGADVRAGQFAEAGPELAPVARPLEPERAGGRVERGLAVLYTFLESAGATVEDVAGVGGPVSLYADDPGAVRRLPGGGLAVDRPTLVASRLPALKVTQACMASRELTVEAWVRPQNTRQAGPARILTVSEGHKAMNFGLGQEGDCWVFRANVQSPGGYVWGEFHSAPGTADLRLTHVVWTRDAQGNLACYVNGRPVPFEGHTGPDTPVVRRLPGSFAPWTSSFRLALANEFDPDRPWLGEYRLAAVYSRALTAAEVRQNFEAAVPRSSPRARQR